MDPTFPDPDWVQTEAESERIEALLEASDEDEANGDDESRDF